MDAPPHQSSTTRISPPHNLPNLVPDIVSSSTTKPNTPCNLLNHPSTVSSSIIVREKSPASSPSQHDNVLAKRFSSVEELHYHGGKSSNNAVVPPPDSLKLEDIHPAQPAVPPRRKKRGARMSASDSADASPVESDVPPLGNLKTCVKSDISLTS